MATNEEVIDNLEIIEERQRNIESKIEQLCQKSAGSVELTPTDKMAIIKGFEDIKENLINAIAGLQAEFLKNTANINEEIKNDRTNYKKEILGQIERLDYKLHEINNLEESYEKKIEKYINSNLTNILNPGLEKINKTCVRLKNAEEHVYKFSQEHISWNFVFLFITCLVGFFIAGIGIENVYEERSAEEVFECFYQERFEKEIAKPLEDAKEQAEIYKNEKENEIEEYTKAKKKEADLYYDETVAAALKKADEEYQMRMGIYLEKTQKEVDKAAEKKRRGDKKANEENN